MGKRAQALAAITLLNTVPGTGDTWRELLRTSARRVGVAIGSATAAGYIAPLLSLINNMPDPLVLSVAFVAEFSRGKSELINAIFFAEYGNRMLPSSAGRTTMCPTELMYDPSLAPSLRLLPIETRADNLSTGDYRDQETEGWEIESQINLTRQWTVRATYSMNRSLFGRFFPLVRPYLAAAQVAAELAATQASGVVIEEREEPAAPAASAPAPKVALTETKTAAVKPEAKPESKPEAKPEPKKPEAKPAEKVAEKPTEKPAAAAKSADAAKAQALLEGKSTAEPKPADHKADKKPAADAGRFVVQVGAYTEAGKLQEARSKVEKAGYKTYTQVVGTKDSQRTRVRIGPFASKADAQKAADKLKKLNLPAAILEL